LDPSFAASKPDEDDGFVKTIKIYGMTSYEGEIKPPAPCLAILWHDKEPITSILLL
jgi:hypothetical protein